MMNQNSSSTIVPAMSMRSKLVHLGAVDTLLNIATNSKVRSEVRTHAEQLLSFLSRTAEGGNNLMLILDNEMSALFMPKTASASQHYKILQILKTLTSDEVQLKPFYTRFTQERRGVDDFIRRMLAAQRVFVNEGQHEICGKERIVVDVVDQGSDLVTQVLKVVHKVLSKSYPRLLNEGRQTLQPGLIRKENQQDNDENSCLENTACNSSSSTFNLNLKEFAPGTITCLVEQLVDLDNYGCRQEEIVRSCALCSPP
eukprot:757628-Hanusia_phi.AAC.2